MSNTQEQKQKVVLAYSGGLDTSVAVHWLRERGYEVVTLTADLGGDVNLEASAAKARSMGCQAFVVDAREEFVTEFVWPALQARVLPGMVPERSRSQSARSGIGPNCWFFRST